MFNQEIPTVGISKSELYLLLARQVSALFDGESDFIANAANLSSLLFYSLTDVNWVGFYLTKGNGLVLGPFQGRVACVRIALGKGVCGTAASERKTLIVGNVHEFVGHIACDSASNSEIVVPLINDGTVIGVLDIDSPLFGRFDEEDREGLEKIVRIFLEKSEV
ncbi:MAG: GAF domain-containing protein [Ignavibacteriae bacterium]|nr:GAF domain-containing protein [Ignavibacteriota bacterium]